MGLHMNWLAVECGDKDAVLTSLGLQETGWVNDELRAQLACATLPNGWTVIVSSDYRLELESLLPAASAKGRAIGCEVSEIVMYSGVRAYQDGEFAWAVTHDPDKERYGVAVNGEPPSQLSDILAKVGELAAAEPDEPVDWWFDAPVELARSVCGYEAGAVQNAEWSTVAFAADVRSAPRRERTLRGAIRAEIMPLLGSLGWEPRVGKAEWPNAFYSASRVHDGHLQFVNLVGKDDGEDVYLFPSFGAWPGEANEGDPLIAGEVRAAHAAIWKRLTKPWRRLTGKRGLDERLDQVVGDAQRAIVDMNEFLTLGRTSPNLRIDLGSAQVWIDALLAKDDAPGG